jgi:hypothetical protein
MRSPIPFPHNLTPAALFLLIGCHPLNTVPAPVSPEAAIQEFQLDIPAGLEVRNVDFIATVYSDVSGNQDFVGSTTGGRAFLKVYAIDRQSGESVLLLYENIAKRKRPVQVIRFRAGSGALQAAAPPSQ